MVFGRPNTLALALVLSRFYPVHPVVILSLSVVFALDIDPHRIVALDGDFD